MSDSLLGVEDYSLSWTYAQAQEFASALRGFLQAYNRVLFEQYPYCLTECRGGCCRVTGAFIAAFDCLALGLLNLPYPRLPERIEAGALDCIYRGARGCLWSSGWRTFKCWLFYCPGGSMEGSFNRSAIVWALQLVMEEHLPLELKRYMSRAGVDLAAHLGDPLAFAEELGVALDRILVGPLDARYSFLAEGRESSYYRNSTAPQESFFCTDEAWSSFVQQISDYLGDLPGSLTDLLPVQCLADLECLEWIRLGKPGDALALLEEMYERYATLDDITDEHCAWISEHIRQHILRLSESFRVPQRLL